MQENGCWAVAGLLSLTLGVSSACAEAVDGGWGPWQATRQTNQAGFKTY
jgi:hypothetical protein